MTPDITSALIRLLHAIRRVTTDQDSSDYQDELYLAAGELIDLLEGASK